MFKIMLKHSDARLFYNLPADEKLLKVASIDNVHIRLKISCNLIADKNSSIDDSAKLIFKED